MFTRFFDSTTPSAIPSGSRAAVYPFGSFAWPASEIDRMSRVFRIVEFGAEPRLAEFCRCVGFEPGGATLGQSLAFLEAREQFGHHDGTAYVNRSEWAAVISEVDSLIAARRLSHHPRYWVATLDGTVGPLIDGRFCWAVQDKSARMVGFNADQSILYGTNDLEPV